MLFFLRLKTVLACLVNDRYAHRERGSLRGSLLRNAKTKKLGSIFEPSLSAFIIASKI